MYELTSPGQVEFRSLHGLVSKATCHLSSHKWSIYWWCRSHSSGVTWPRCSRSPGCHCCSPSIDCYTALAWLYWDCRWPGYETWHQIGWLYPFVIGWSRYRLRLPRVALHFGLTWLMGISTVLQRLLTVHLPIPKASKCVPLGLC